MPLAVHYRSRRAEFTLSPALVQVVLVLISTAQQRRQLLQMEPGDGERDKRISTTTGVKVRSKLRLPRLITTDLARRLRLKSWSHARERPHPGRTAMR